jgi:hypothetical protein
MFSLQKNQRTRGQNRFCLEAVGEGGRLRRGGSPNNVTHVSKCKNDKKNFLNTLVPFKEIQG